MGSLEEKVLLADVQRYLAIKKEKEDEGLKTIEREQAYLVHEADYCFTAKRCFSRER